MKYEVVDVSGLKSIIRYPDGCEKGKKYPVILFLHGAGTRGEDINILLSNVFFSITEEHTNFPFIVIAPQCNKDNWFELMYELQGLTAEITNFDFADEERVYAVGASMGGYGVWQLAMNMPHTFAAIVPICGGGMYRNAKRLTGTDIWAFHGDRDNVVYTEESVKMVEKVNEAGGRATLTIYKNTEHDSWTETYSNPEVFKWMLQFKKTANKDVLSDNIYDSKLYG